MQNAGWLAVYGREAQPGDDAAALAPLSGGQVATKALELRAAQTKPPARFTEATLLSAMEGAGRLVEDEDLREAMREKGLGTPATRAAIIEGLISEDYLHRLGRDLQPTPKAFSLMFALRHFGITELSSPELTGAWEHKLRQIERGELKRKVFMDHIVETTREMVERIRGGNIPEEAFATLNSACPACGGTVQENYRKFKCQSCDFAVWRVVSGRELAPEELEELITKGSVGPLTGFRSRMGRPFAAVLKLGPEHRVEFDFGQNGADSDGADTIPDLSGQEPLGSCPKCGARVFEQPMTYVCERALGAQRSCDFRSGRVILQRPIERAQMQQLLSTGRTELLHRFISKKGRPFSAYLVRGSDGNVGFEFAPKTARPASRGAAPAKRDSPPRQPSGAARSPPEDAPVRSRRAAKSPARRPSAPPSKGAHRRTPRK